MSPRRRNLFCVRDYRDRSDRMEKMEILLTARFEISGLKFWPESLAYRMCRGIFWLAPFSCMVWRHHFFTDKMGQRSSVYSMLKVNHWQPPNKFHLCFGLMSSILWKNDQPFLLEVWVLFWNKFWEWEYK